MQQLYVLFYVEHEDNEVLVPETPDVAVVNRKKGPRSNGKLFPSKSKQKRQGGSRLASAGSDITADLSHDDRRMVRGFSERSASSEPANIAVDTLAHVPNDSIYTSYQPQAMVTSRQSNVGITKAIPDRDTMMVSIH